MMFVVGSGSSAISAVVALVRRGCRPTVLDTGLTPDAQALALKEILASKEPENWTPTDVSPLKCTGPVAANGIPRKLHFGSDFSFRQIGQAMALDLEQASMHRSFAAGGFSNVWGAVVQPLSRSDLVDWPVTIEELAPHYESALGFLFDTPTAVDMPSVSGLHPSSQAEDLYKELLKNRQSLERIGMRFQYSKLAVRVEDRNGYKGCRYCGLCLYGCPYDCRYSAHDTLMQLVRENKIRGCNFLSVNSI
jgi:ferredoxin